MRLIALGFLFLLAGCGDSGNHCNRGYVITQSHDRPEEPPTIELAPRISLKREFLTSLKFLAY